MTIATKFRLKKLPSTQRRQDNLYSRMIAFAGYRIKISQINIYPLLTLRNIFNFISAPSRLGNPGFLASSKIYTKYNCAWLHNGKSYSNKIRFLLFLLIILTTPDIIESLNAVFMFQFEQRTSLCYVSL